MGMRWTHRNWRVFRLLITLPMAKTFHSVTKDPARARHRHQVKKILEPTFELLRAFPSIQREEITKVTFWGLCDVQQLLFYRN